MTAQTNQDVMKAFAQSATPYTLNDNLNASFATAAGAQNQGLGAKGEILRIVQSVSTGAVVLPTIGGLDGSGLVIVINDSPNSINVGAAAGDKINNVATTSSFGAGIQAIAAGAWGVFVAAGAPLGIGGGPPAAPNFNNWHAAVGTGA